MGYLVAPAQKSRLYPAQQAAQLWGPHELNTRLDGLGPAFLAGVFTVPVCSSWDFVSTSIHVHFMTPPSSYAVPGRLFGLLGGTGAETPAVPCPASRGIVGASRIERPAG
jgi:hypothetical protein